MTLLVALTGFTILVTGNLRLDHHQSTIIFPSAKNFWIRFCLISFSCTFCRIFLCVLHLLCRTIMSAILFTVYVSFSETFTYLLSITACFSTVRNSVFYDCLHLL